MARQHRDSRTGVMRNIGRFVTICALGLVLAACSPVIRHHGYVPTDADLAQIEVGKADRETVAVAIGRPSAQGLLQESAWYYVASQFRHSGPFKPKETTREVLAVSFGANGKVSNIERFGLADGEVIRLSARVTESSVAGTSFLRQLLGNIGRISAERLFAN